MTMGRRGLLAAAVLAFCFVPVRADAPRVIKIDGKFDDWKGIPSVIVVDAVAPIGEPGRIHRFDLTDGPVPIAFAPRSTHAFGVAETVELARSLGRLPGDLVVYLVEGERFTTGAPLSPAVAKAVDEVAELIIAELPRISSDHEAAAGASSHA